MALCRVGKKQQPIVKATAFVAKRTGLLHGRVIVNSTEAVSDLRFLVSTSVFAADGRGPITSASVSVIVGHFYRRAAPLKLLAIRKHVTASTSDVVSEVGNSITATVRETASVARVCNVPVKRSGILSIGERSSRATASLLVPAIARSGITTTSKSSSEL